MTDIDPNNIIVIDESGANLGMTNDYARSEGGTRAKAPKAPKPHNPGTRFSLIGAIGLKCVLALSYVQSAVDTQIFDTFIEKMLLKKLTTDKYVVMDNVRFHKNSAIIEKIERTGAKVVFLPPYSPDLSPIENMWSKIKYFLKYCKPRSNAEFHTGLANALEQINEDDLIGWYEECGYTIDV
jgi:transposase